MPSRVAALERQVAHERKVLGDREEQIAAVNRELAEIEATWLKP